MTEMRKKTYNILAGYHSGRWTGLILVLVFIIFREKSLLHAKKDTS